MVQMRFSDDIKTVESEVKGCERCGLCNHRKNAVPGEGPRHASVMLIGEAPGRNEDLKGRPFVGRAGDLLDRLLKSSDMSREDVFITNVVKCRPPENRDPRSGEISTCRPYLDRQINLIEPKVIGTLGNHATKALLDVTGISEIHGKIFMLEGKKVVPLYHPAAGLYNPNLLSVMKKDFALLASHK